MKYKHLKNDHRAYIHQYKEYSQQLSFSNSFSDWTWKSSVGAAHDPITQVRRHGVYRMIGVFDGPLVHNEYNFQYCLDELW